MYIRHKFNQTIALDKIFVQLDKKRNKHELIKIYKGFLGVLTLKFKSQISIFSLASSSKGPFINQVRHLLSKFDLLPSM